MDIHNGLPLDRQMRAALRGAIRRSGKSRQQIAEELSGAQGLNVSVHILNNWTGDSKRERRLPAVVIPAICAVLGDDLLQRLLLTQEQLARLELGESVSKWLNKRFAIPQGDRATQRVRRKAARRAAATASRP